MTIDYAYGDKVWATYRAYPNTAKEILPTREGVIVDPGFGEGMFEVFFGTLEEYDALAEAEKFDSIQERVGVFYYDELVLA